MPQVGRAFSQDPQAIDILDDRRYPRSQRAQSGRRDVAGAQVQGTGAAVLRIRIARLTRVDIDRQDLSGDGQMHRIFGRFDKARDQGPQQHQGEESRRPDSHGVDCRGND